MKNIISPPDRESLNRLVAETEKRLDAQVVLAVIKRCDSYAEIPWKAFAMGASAAGLVLFLLNLAFPVWATPFLLLAAIVVVLTTGAVLALATVFIPSLSRVFLAAHRAETEVQQYAESVFLSHEVFATQKRNGLLLLISLFERQVYLLPDKGIRNKLGEKETHEILESMKPFLQKRDLKRAFETGLDQVAKLLAHSGDAPVDRPNELSNQIIEEEGI
jgi:putative membrane protein